MKKFLLFFLLFSIIIPFAVKAQFETFKDSVVQLYGVVMTADSLKGIPAVSIMIKGQNRGTITNDQGVFSIVVLKGDQIEFSSIGYKPKLVSIPKNLEGNQQSIIQLLVQDTIYLPATIINTDAHTRQFERDFVNVKVSDDDQEIARKIPRQHQNQSFYLQFILQTGRKRPIISLRGLPPKLTMQATTSQKIVFNPLAWAEFINVTWKRGDSKRKAAPNPGRSLRTPPRGKKSSPPPDGEKPKVF